MLYFGRAVPLGQQISLNYSPFGFITEFWTGIRQACAASTGMIAMSEAPALAFAILGQEEGAGSSPPALPGCSSPPAKA